MNKIQLFAVNTFEFSATDGTGVITGYIPYYDKSKPGSEYAITDKVKIRFAKGAFDKALASEDPIFAYYNHDSSSVIASTQNDTLKFTDFPSFLRYQATLNLNDPDAMRVYSKISSGLVAGTSFGGTIDKDDWFSEEEYDINLITEFGMYEVSPTARPAFTGSKVVIRAGEDALLQNYAAWRTRRIDEKIARLKP